MKPLLPGSRSDLLGPMLQLLTSEKMATMDVFGALEEALKNSDFLVIVYFFFLVCSCYDK